MKATIRELLTKKSVLMMGVLNVTPDSFSDGGEYVDVGMAVKRVEEMIRAGVDIVDIGGESTRPYAEPVSEAEELRRVIPVIEAIANEEALISIDTTKSSVAKAALDLGATIVNDISSFEIDEKMARVVAEHNAEVVLMHMQGRPTTMQNQPTYANVMDDIIAYLRQRMELAQSCGIELRNIVIDPGIGFGKSVEDNLKIVNQLSRFEVLGVPVLVGVSRKSFIGKVLNIDNPQERIFGTAAALCLSVRNGANIVRVHDIEEMNQVLTMTQAILNG